MSAGGNIPGYKAFAVGRPWVLGVQNQVVSYCAMGVCDPSVQNSVSALEPFRYATGLFAWQSLATAVPTGGGAGQPINTDGNNLTIASGATLNLFQAGVGDAIPLSDGTTWWVNTISDTDLLRSGAPIDRGFMFLGTGLVFEAMEPFQRGGTFTAPTDPKLFSKWLERQDDGPGYGQAIQQAMINYTAMQVSFSDAGTTFRIGVGAFYPQWGGPSGSQSIRNGNVGTPGTYLPFTTGICTGSRDDVRQLTLALLFGQSATVQNNPTEPTVSGSTLSGVINTANNGTVYAPVRVTLVGYMVCVPSDAYCGVPSFTPDEVMALRSQLGQVAMSPGMQPGVQYGAYSGPGALVPTSG